MVKKSWSHSIKKNTLKLLFLYKTLQHRNKIHVTIASIIQQPIISHNELFESVITFRSVLNHWNKPRVDKYFSEQLPNSKKTLNSHHWHSPLHAGKVQNQSCPAPRKSGVDKRTYSWCFSCSIDQRRWFQIVQEKRGWNFIKRQDKVRNEFKSQHEQLKRYWNICCIKHKSTITPRQWIHSPPLRH